MKERGREGGRKRGRKEARKEGRREGSDKLIETKSRIMVARGWEQCGEGGVVGKRYKLSVIR